MENAPVVIDLFAGAGGLTLGALRAGFDVALAVELDANAIKTHIANFPNSLHMQMDISSLSSEEILGALPYKKRSRVAGIVGGPPCQGFSNMGKGKADDPRNNLFVRFFEIVSALQPTFYVAENVPGILNEKYACIRREALGKVANYTVLEPLIVKACDLGAPTTRTRVFFIGVRDPVGGDVTSDSLIAQAKLGVIKTTVEEALDGLPSQLCCAEDGFIKLTERYRNDSSNQNPFFYLRTCGLIPEKAGFKEYLKKHEEGLVNGCYPTRHTEAVINRFKALRQGETDTISRARRLELEGFCPTIRAGTGPDRGSFQAVRPIHPTEHRVITPREAARLQGFPDWFSMPNTIWHGFRQIGNSVSPIVAEKILGAINQKLTL